jgi:hypothetical protein
MFHISLERSMNVASQSGKIALGVGSVLLFRRGIYPSAALLERLLRTTVRCW